MLQNIYSLPDLIDLALRVPEVGAVNFNILHTVLQAVVKELKMSDVRPWCHIENPLLTKAALTKSKLEDTKQRRNLSQETVSEKTYTAPSERKSVSEDAKSKPDDQSQFDTQQQDGPENAKESSDAPTTDDLPQDRPAKTDSATQVEEGKEPGIPLSAPTKKDSAVQVEAQEAIPEEVVFIPPESRPSDKLGPPPDAESKESVKEESVPKSGRRGHTAADAWKYASLDKRIQGAEEGLHKLSNIVDIIADRIRKADQRKKEGGPSSEELEAIDERLCDLEEKMAMLLADHELLMEMKRKLDEMLADFEAIKALAAQIKQMQIDLSMKADKAETQAALDLKGDLELVNTKVDQLEFETAIEELGEAIGLLGLKFTRKNEEWEERAAEMWRGIDSKMARDVFDAAMVKIESRLIALMYGLKRMKKVVEDLLYPESSGVTRCILCRRPACISGLECFSACNSPKRPLSDKSSESDESEKLKKNLSIIVTKKQKLEVPPYCESPDTILSMPYSSASYKTESSIYKKNQSQIPKLPDIKDGEPSSRSSKDRAAMSIAKQRQISRGQKEELFYTNKLSKEAGDDQKTEKHEYTVDLESDGPKITISRPSSRSSASSVDIIPDPLRNIQRFTPARLIPDTLRRSAKSPYSQKRQKPAISLAPVKFNISSSSRLTEKDDTE